MTLGERIQTLRKEHSLSQKELANLVGVTIGTVAEWEADESAPSLTELSRLSKALDVSADVLLDATAEDTTACVVKSTQEEKAVIVPAKKRKKAGLIIGLVAILVATLAVGAFVLFNPVPFAENSAAIEAADASVVTIFCYDYEGELAATGSGFIAFDGQTVITNYHVMTSAYTCKISTNQDISYEVTGILCYSKEQDIAILQLEKDTGLLPLTLGDSGAIKKGETVVAIGSPLGIKNTVSTGVLSGRLMEDNMDVLQFTAPISSGSSGGALFDNNGNVIGITYASYVAGQNLNLAIPIELAIGLYNSRGSVKNVSTIYAEEHPYITYLCEYKNAPVVTLADLKTNPEKYDDKIIRMSIYVSSWSKPNGYWWDEGGGGTWYLSNKEYISYDIDYDENIAIPARYGIEYKDSPIITCETNNKCVRYIDGSVVAGDKIEIIAHFDFSPEGESLFPDDPECTIYWEYDFASLEAIVIWKS